MSKTNNIDKALRPESFDDYIGQNRIKENLRVTIEAAKKRDEPIDHVIFSGQPGLGKTSLAFLIAKEMGADIILSTGPALAKGKIGDLAGILVKLKKGDVFFIDEIHRLSIEVEEFLYTAMEDRRIDITLGSGADAKTMPIQLSPFTLIGATTREDLLTKAFRDRFDINETLEPYSIEDSIAIAKRSSLKLGVDIDKKAAEILSQAARGVPRKINKFLRRCRDISSIKENSENKITEEIAEEGLRKLGIDKNGLEKEERKVLEWLSNLKKPIGLNSLAKSLNMGPKSIEDVYEPYLLQRGYITISTSGRVITEKGQKALGNKTQGTMF